jgi:hypothetical protein
MATNLNLHESVEPRRVGCTAPSVKETGEHDCSLTNNESHGFVAILDEPEVPEAVERAKRENPGALIHLESLGSEIWSLQVYRSEAAQEVFRLRFYYQHIAIASLALRRNGEYAKNT